MAAILTRIQNGPQIQNGSQIQDGCEIQENSIYSATICGILTKLETYVQIQDGRHLKLKFKSKMAAILAKTKNGPIQDGCQIQSKMAQSKMATKSKMAAKPKMATMGINSN